MMDIDSLYFVQNSLSNLIEMVGENWFFHTGFIKDPYRDGMTGTRIAFDCSRMNPATKPRSCGYAVDGFRLDKLPSVRVFECSIPRMQGSRGVIFLSLSHVPRIRPSGMMTNRELSIVCTLLNFTLDALKKSPEHSRQYNSIPKFRVKAQNTIVTKLWKDKPSGLGYGAVKKFAMELSETIKFFTELDESVAVEKFMDYPPANGRRENLFPDVEVSGDELIEEVRTMTRIWRVFRLGLVWSFSLAGVKNCFKEFEDLSMDLKLGDDETLDDCQARLEQWTTTKSHDLKRWLMEEAILKHEIDDEGNRTTNGDGNYIIKEERAWCGQYFFDIGLDFIPLDRETDLFPSLEGLVHKFRGAMNEQRENISAYMAGAENTHTTNHEAQQSAQAATRRNERLRTHMTANQQADHLLENGDGDGELPNLVSETNNNKSCSFVSAIWSTGLPTLPRLLWCCQCQFALTVPPYSGQLPRLGCP